MSTAVPFNPQNKFVKGRNWVKYPRPNQTDPNEFTLTEEAFAYLTTQATSTAEATSLVASASVEDQNAAIGATDISDGALAAGVYQFDWFVMIRTAAGVSSSATVSVDFTLNAQTKTLTYSAVNGNTTGTFGHGGGLVWIDNASPVRYSVAYASNAAGVMHYDAYFTLRRVA